MNELHLYAELRIRVILLAPAQKDYFLMSHLTSHEALRLTATFAFTADRMRAANRDLATRASICETASRIAFLRAQSIAQREQIIPSLGQCYRRAVYSVA